MRVDIDLLEPTEVYLIDDSVKGIEDIFKEDGIEGLPKIKVMCWEGRYIIVDGNTRTYIFYRNGVRKLDVNHVDYDETSSELVQIAKKYGVNHISDLEGRVVNEKEYDKFWTEFFDLEDSD